MTDLEIKQAQFNTAMERYEHRPTYKRIDKTVAIVNIALQIMLLSRIIPLAISPWQQAASFVLAFFLTDFINGLIHMYMDRNDNYESFAGPLIAKFHLHHKNPRYKDHNLLVVYFNETGSKVWLVFYLSAVTALSYMPGMNPVMLHVMVCFGILSSVAEVSHYLCHNSQAPAVFFLARTGILLSKKRHARHHLADNVNYTFLNGMSDPLVNFIAGKWSPGYKKGTDLHFANYEAEQDVTRQAVL